MKTHIDTLADNTPKARRRLRKRFAIDVKHGQNMAIARERKEAKWVKETRWLAKNGNRQQSMDAYLELAKKGYR